MLHRRAPAAVGAADGRRRRGGTAAERARRRAGSGATAASAGAPRRATSASSARYVGVEARGGAQSRARRARRTVGKPGVVSPAGRLARAGRRRAWARAARQPRRTPRVVQENAELRKTSERQRRALKRMQAVEDDAAARGAAADGGRARRDGQQLDDAKHALAQCRAENRGCERRSPPGSPTWGV